MSDFSLPTALAAVRTAINDPSRHTRRRNLRSADGSQTPEPLGAWQARAALSVAVNTLATNFDQLHVVVPAEHGGWFCNGCRSETTSERCPTLQRLDRIRATIEEGM